MKNSIILLSLLVLTLCYSSCKKDENSISKNLIVCTVATDFLEEGETSYIWLTNSSNGSILDFVQLENGLTVEITKPNSFEDERFSLHRLIIDEDENYRIYTFADIKGGTINFKNPYSPYGENIGTATLNFSSVPNHEYYFISPAYNGDELEQKEVYIHENTSQAYLYLQKGSIGYYKFIQNLQAGETRDISLANMSTNMTPHGINFTGGDNLNYVRIIAYEDESDYYTLGTGLYAKSNFSEDASQVFFHTPNEANLFNKYLSYIRLNDQYNSNKTYRYRTYGQIPEAFEYINADIQIQSSDVHDLKLTSIGEFDFFWSAFHNYANGNSATWNFYNSSGNNIDFPQIPLEITNLYPQIKKENILSEETSYSLFLYDYDHLQNYDDYINYRFFRGERNGLLDGVKNDRSIQYRF